MQIEVNGKTYEANKIYVSAKRLLEYTNKPSFRVVLDYWPVSEVIKVIRINEDQYKELRKGFPEWS